MTLLKTIVLGTQFFALFLVDVMYAPKAVKVEHNIPTSSVKGAEHWVYVDVDKGKVSGFAKMQIDVPDGMSVEPGDLRGASFTFSEGSAKIIWMALPRESEFKLSFKLTVLEECKAGNNAIKIKLAYLEKNERKVFELPEHNMFIGDENVSNIFVPDTLANGTRSITQLNGDHFLVEIELYKDGIKGFAKIEEIIPAGMNAEAVKKSNSVFTQLDNKVKFVWFSIPDKDTLVIVYEVFSDRALNGLLPIDGQFTYLRDNETKTVTIENSIKMPSDQVVLEPSEEIVEETSEEQITETIEESLTEESNTETLTEEVENNTEIIPEEVVVEQIVEENIKQPVEVIVEESVEQVTETVEEINQEVIEATTQTEQVSNIPEPETGITYRVQIAAGKNVVDEVYFEKRHKFNDPFTIENHEDWIKYTTGSHPIYKEARDSRNYITDNFNFDGPFVTAYVDGGRITVQEALMITRQKWYR